MKLGFENWIEASDAPTSARTAFGEAVVCYKAGAYRAGLLFSYVGAGLWLRFRILSASRPTQMPQGQWDSILNKLKRDDQWDSETFKCTQMRTPPVFDVDEHLRQEILYWKNRRNDCAHYKSNIISAAHVESFWHFLESKMGLMVPNGSAEDLLQKLEQHFDLNVTRAGEDVGPLIAKIPHTVLQTRLDSFWQELCARFTTHEGGFRMTDGMALTCIFDEVLCLNHNDIVPSAVNWLLQETRILLGVLRRNPSHVLKLEGNPQEIRLLWRTQLFQRRESDLPIFVALLRNGLIPKAETEEALTLVVERLRGGVISDTDSRVLERHGFWDKFRDHMIERDKLDDFGWSNPNARLITWYFENHPITERAALKINATFDENRHYPNTTCDALKSMFEANQDKRVELEEVLDRLGLNLPNAWG